MLAETKRRTSVVNLDLVTANQEYSWPVPEDCARLTIKARTEVNVQFATEKGKVGAAPNKPYYTIKSGDDLDLRYPLESILYFACGSTATLEILVEVEEQESEE